MATTADLAEAVVASLNAGVFSLTFTAVRAYLPLFDLGQMLDLQVTVVAAGRTVQPCGRGLLQVDHRIEIAVQQKLTSEGVAQCDPLLALVEEIADHLRGGPLPGLPEAAWVGTEHAPLVAPEHLNELRQFTSVLAITYRTWER